jgi:hypothetical protein
MIPVMAEVVHQNPDYQFVVAAVKNLLKNYTLDKRDNISKVCLRIYV